MTTNEKITIAVETIKGVGKGILVIPAILIAIAIVKAIFGAILAV